MKKTAMIFMTFTLLLAGCASHYTTNDGEYLKQYVDPEALKALVESDQTEIRIIDVRPASMYEKGHVPKAENFPSSEILERLDELPREAPYILYCETGGRAQAVIRMLEKENYTTLLNWGGYTRWPYELVTD